jgi:O-antigen/teichoic acid export membrane protein
MMEPAPETTGSASVVAPATPLGGQFVRALAWTSVLRWLGQIVRWGSTLVIARILSPSDYGLVGMSTYLVGLMQLLAEFGLSAAVVRMRDLSDDTVRQLNTVALLTGLASLALASVFAIPLARFFGEPRVASVVVVAGLGFVVTSLMTVPNAMLQRRLQFKRIIAADTIATVVLALSTLGLAAAGAGYWALVGGPLIGSAISMLLQRYWSPVGFAVPRPAALQGVLRFTGQVLVARLAWYLYSNADFVVVGRALGPAALGAYAIAWSLAFVPIEQTNTIISRVSPAFLAAVQTDIAQARRYFLNLTEAIATLTMPAALGLAAVAPAFVRTVLPPKWSGAVLPLALLSGFAAFRCLTLLYSPVLVAFGDTRANMRVSLLSLAVLPPTFLIAAHFGGAPGVALSWLVFFPVGGLPQLRRVQRVLQLRSRDYLAAIGPAVVASVPMVAGAVGVGLALEGRVPPFAQLVAQTAAGAVLYAGIYALLFRARLRRLRSAVQSFRAR